MIFGYPSSGCLSQSADYQLALRSTLMLLRSLTFPDKAEVKAEQEENKMQDGADAVDVRREYNVRAQQRYRQIRKVEISLNPSADKECSSQEFTNITASNGQI